MEKDAVAMGQPVVLFNLMRMLARAMCLTSPVGCSAASARISPTVYVRSARTQGGALGLDKRRVDSGAGGEFRPCHQPCGGAPLQHRGAQRVLADGRALEPMSRRHSISLSIILATTTLCTTAGGGPPAPSRIEIRAEHSGWGSRSTNLTLILYNGVYVAGTYTVAPALISNLMAVAKHPWPKPATNTWPSFTVVPANLGLDAAWLRTNYQRLLQAFSTNTDNVPFPKASERQRAWLTNALADVELLGEGLRGCFGTFWTDDYPSLELRFENDDGQTVEQVFRLSTRAQPSFMLPWQVYDGTNEFTSGNADISRAVVQVLPSGFLLRDRLNGDLFQMVRGGFLQLRKVNEFIKKSTLEDTLGDEVNVFLQVFAPRYCGVSGSSYSRYPDSFMATLHRTNWPAGLTMPIQAGVEHGVVTNLKAILDNADRRVAPLLKQEWLMSRFKSPGGLSVEVKAEGSPDHQWLRGHMDKVGRAAFYDRIQPALRRSLGFLLREGSQRSSEWAILEDGRLLLYGFTGDGVLDWWPAELGFQGDERMLHSWTINRVGVFIGPKGTITEVVPPERK
jgi:hypothetical protein